MKKKIALICMVAVVIVLAGSAAWAYTASFSWTSPADDVNSYQSNYTTDVASPYPYFGGASPYWGLQIGDNNFKIGGTGVSAAYVVNYNNQTYLTIYTGWGTIPNASGGNGLSGNQYSEYGAVAADLSIYNSLGTLVAMVGLNSSRQGNLYTNASASGGTITYQTSYDLFKGGYKGSNVIFGGNYRGLNNSSTVLVPVLATSKPSTAIFTNPLVTWVAPTKQGIQPGSSGINGTLGTNNSGSYEVEVDLSDIQSQGIVLSGGFSFLYPTATCANSELHGCYTGKVTGVPLPPSALLLGSGLLGLAGLGWRRKKAS